MKLVGVDIGGTFTDIVYADTVPYVPIMASGTFVAIGPAGGGLGDPFRRDPLDVLDDVLDALITPETACTAFGVVINGNQVDGDVPAALRAGGNARDDRGPIPW